MNAVKTAVMGTCHSASPFSQWRHTPGLLVRASHGRPQLHVPVLGLWTHRQTREQDAS